MVAVLVISELTNIGEKLIDILKKTYKIQVGQFHYCIHVYIHCI